MGILYPDDSSRLLLQQVSGSHLASCLHSTTKLHPNAWHCLGYLTGTGLCWLEKATLEPLGVHIYFLRCTLRERLGINAFIKYEG